MIVINLFSEIIETTWAKCYLLTWKTHMKFNPLTSLILKKVPLQINLHIYMILGFTLLILPIKIDKNYWTNLSKHYKTLMLDLLTLKIKILLHVEKLLPLTDFWIVLIKSTLDTLTWELKEAILTCLDTLIKTLTDWFHWMLSLMVINLVQILLFLFNSDCNSILKTEVSRLNPPKLWLEIYGTLLTTHSCSI